jgi:hypothetical protein
VAASGRIQIDGREALVAMNITKSSLAPHKKRADLPKTNNSPNATTLRPRPTLHRKRPKSSSLFGLTVPLDQTPEVRKSGGAE